MGFRMNIILDIVLVTLLFNCVLYIFRLRDKVSSKSGLIENLEDNVAFWEKKSVERRQEADQEYSERKNALKELRAAKMILVANDIIAPEEDLDNIAAVKQEVPRCEKIDLKKAYFEAWELTKTKETK